MPKKMKKPAARKVVLRLPDLDHAKSSVLSSLSSLRSRRNYKFAMEQFITWYCSEPRLALNRTVVLRSGNTSNHSVWPPVRSIKGSLQSGALHTRRQIQVCSAPNLPLGFGELRV
jgi:hypothetical protein